MNSKPGDLHPYGVPSRPNGSLRSGDLVLGAARIEAEAASKRGDPCNSASRKRAVELRERVATAPGGPSDGTAVHAPRLP